MKIISMINSKIQQAKQKTLYKEFLASGKKPWTPGYNTYKTQTITSNIDNKIFDVNHLVEGYGYRIDERIIEYPWLFSKLPLGCGRLLDAGSALNFPYLLEREPLLSKELYISTLSPEKCYFGEKKISYIFEDLRSSCFKSDFFDYIVSISTIEHIGLDNTFLYTNDLTKKENEPHTYLKAILEFARMLTTGGRLFLTMPYGLHKNHGWFQVFNSEMVDNVIDTFRPTTFEEYYFSYEPSGWVISSREESKNATCFDINVQKEYDDDFAAFSRGLVCLELVK